MRKIIHILFSFFFICCISFFGFVGTGCASTGESPLEQNEPQAKQCTLKMKQRYYNVFEGESTSLLINFTLDGENEDLSLLKFSSDNEAVATVNAFGIVTGVSAGKANISIAYGDKKVSAYITVKTPVYNLMVAKGTLGLLKGTTKEVDVTAYIGEDIVTNPNLVWSSKNPGIAAVENGRITAVNVGETEITVAFRDVQKTIHVFISEEIEAQSVNTFDEEYINIYGRSYISNGKLHLDHAANAVELGIFGSSLTINISTTAESYMRVYVDNEMEGEWVAIMPSTTTYTIVNGLTEEYHHIRIVKATEEDFATWQLASFEAEAFVAVPEKEDLKIEFIGDSITTGLAVFANEREGGNAAISDCTKAYAYVAAQELDADYSTIARQGICAKAYHWAWDINMETLYKRVSITNKQEYAFDFNPDIIVLNLGTNEASYLDPQYGGTSYGDLFPNDYQALLELVREKNPNAHIICLYGMMGANSVIESGIKAAIKQMQDDNIVYNPFSIVVDYSSGGHPSKEAHKANGKALAGYIKGLNA